VIWVSALLGAIMGSFFNMLIYRLPRGLSIIKPRSMCPACGHRLTWTENIPVVSYLLLKGRCKNCGKRIPFRYLVVEIITSAAYAYAYWRSGLSPLYLVDLIFFSLLILIAFTDLETYLIPDVYSIGGIFAGLALSGPNPLVSWKGAVVGVILGGSIFAGIAYAYARIRKQEGLGGGDIKLLAMIGAFTGCKGIIITIFISAVTGLLAGFIAIWKSKKGLQTMIPYGPFLATGGFIAYIWGNRIMDWYIRSLST